MASFAAMTAFGERDAKACGGCFHPPTQVSSDITDERMLLSISPRQTTLYDQIRYTGNPSSFAWVLPIKGTVEVGLSADVMFDAIDALTTTSVTGPTITCPSCGGGGGGGSGFGCGSSADSATSFGGAVEADASTVSNVTVTKQENV
ncbi:MAG TPA: DUF2330 domain-containing protein, partial [Polyangiaceae bacterium]